MYSKYRETWKSRKNKYSNNNNNNKIHWWATTMMLSAIYVSDVLFTQTARHGIAIMFDDVMQFYWWIDNMALAGRMAIHGNFKYAPIKSFCWIKYMLDVAVGSTFNLVSLLQFHLRCVGCCHEKIPSKYISKWKIYVHIAIPFNVVVHPRKSLNKHNLLGRHGIKL